MKKYTTPSQTVPDDKILVRISAKSANLRFNGCDPAYIRDVCHGRCCRTTATETGTLITIHPTERAAIVARGGRVVRGFLQPRAGEKICPFQDPVAGTCAIHKTPDKPIECIASPFMLNKNGTLVIRNRYKFLKCYNTGPRLPAYVAFRAALNLMFGTRVAAGVCKHLAAGGGDLWVPMDRRVHGVLMDKERAIRGTSVATFTIRGKAYAGGKP